jgi:hypothetical protein
VAIFREELKLPLTPPVLEVSCILPKVLSFYLYCFSSWSILLVRKPRRCSTFLPPEESHTLSLCFLNLRDLVSPQTLLFRGLWEVIGLPFCLLRAQVLTSLRSSAPLPCWYLCFTDCIVCLRPSPRLENESLLEIKLSLGTWWDHFSLRSGGCTLATREVTNHCLRNPGSEPPRNVAGYQAEIRDTEAV